MEPQTAVERRRIDKTLGLWSGLVVAGEARRDRDNGRGEEAAANKGAESATLEGAETPETMGGPKPKTTRRILKR